MRASAPSFTDSLGTCRTGSQTGSSAVASCTHEVWGEGRGGGGEGRGRGWEGRGRGGGGDGRGGGGEGRGGEEWMTVYDTSGWHHSILPCMGHKHQSE